MRKKIAVLGITGSIGESTVKIVDHHADQFEIVFASAHTNYQELLQIAKNMKIKKIVLSAKEPKIHLHDSGIKLYQGQDILLDLIRNEDFDVLINAVSGSAGLIYTIACLERGKDLALANKESLVMAGHIIQELLLQHKAQILPVDSEHSAIFQLLHRHPQDEIKCLHLTASGGPFRTLPWNEFSQINLHKTLQHPTWSMGKKVTIDSATMLNKGLEVIEAHWLFGIEYERIKALIHPQSIVHSMIEFIDGSIFAQMSSPTMQLPILYALTHPHHIMSTKVETNLENLATLSFEPIDPKRYPLFHLACQAGRMGGIMPTVLNAANEKAIKLFCQNKISFIEMPLYVENVLNSIENISHPDLETILAINEELQK